MDVLLCDKDAQLSETEIQARNFFYQFLPLGVSHVREIQRKCLGFTEQAIQCQNVAT